MVKVHTRDQDNSFDIEYLGIVHFAAGHSLCNLLKFSTDVENSRKPRLAPNG